MAYVVCVCSMVIFTTQLAQLNLTLPDIEFVRVILQHVMEDFTSPPAFPEALN